MNSKRPKRSFLVTLLVWTVLILTIYNAVRLGTALAQWDLILKRMPVPGPFYIAITGLFWTLVLVGVSLNIWFAWKWVRPTTAVVLLLYSAYYWLDRLLFQSAQPRENWLFSLVLTILFWLFSALALFMPGSRKYFNKQREHYD